MTRESSSARPAGSGQYYAPPLTSWERWQRKYLRSGRAWLAYGVVAAVVAGLIVVKVVVFAPPPAPAAPCPASLVPADDGNRHDCVGLTDGSFVFSPALASVEHKIRTENQQVGEQAATQHRQWVAIAYLVPMTLNQASPITLESVTRQLEGAYTGQWEANNEAGLYGDAPLIKLYLVNEGSEQVRWKVAVNQILAATRDALHVVAVAGLGDSVVATRDAATAMSASTVLLAMFGTSITADDLNGSKYTSLVRVAPTNDDEVGAALAFLSRLRGSDATAMLVKDTDPSDDYAKNWATDLTALYPGAGHQFVSPPATFDPSLPDVGNLLQGDAQVVCGKHPDVAFFAGRAQQLEVFIGALGAQCTKPITVISGDDDVIDASTSDSPRSYPLFRDALSRGVVSLYSTELASSQEWSDCGAVPASQALAARAFPQFESDYQQQVGKQFSSLSDPSDVMLSRDAVITAVTAIRKSESEPGDGGATQPFQYQQVTQYLTDLQFTAVNGASGVITIGNDGSTKGDAADKPLVIMKHLGDGGERCQAIEAP